MFRQVLGSTLAKLIIKQEVNRRKGGNVYLQKNQNTKFDPYKKQKQKDKSKK